ncbi:hypothetical protein UlMin_015142 [Ulmus minor]
MQRGGKKRMAMPEEEEEQEEQIEKFFEIIRRIKEAQASLVKCSIDETEVSAKAAKKAKKVHGAEWIPTFELEDFAGLQKNNACKNIVCSNKGQREQKGKKEDKGLDLNLTL